MNPLPNHPRRGRLLFHHVWLPLLLLLFVMAPGCSSPPTEPHAATGTTSDPSILRVGITPNIPPMVFKQGSGYAGIEIDLANQLGLHLGRQVRFIEIPWEQQIDALLAGRTDIIMSSMTITTPRQIRIQFSLPYMRSGQAALVRREESGKLQLFFFNDPLKVGIQPGTTGDYFVQQYMRQAKPKTYPNADDAARDVARKKLDVLIHDAPVIWWLASAHENDGLTILPELLTEELLGWGMRKDDPALHRKVNQFLEQSAQSGALNQVIQRWIPTWTARN